MPFPASGTAFSRIARIPWSPAAICDGGQGALRSHPLARAIHAVLWLAIPEGCMGMP
jgi:hypothetical protein